MTDFHQLVTPGNNTLEKLLHSDWLRAVQFMCNISAKSVTPVQITNEDLRNQYKEPRRLLTAADGHTRYAKDGQSSPEALRRLPKIIQ